MPGPVPPRRLNIHYTVVGLPSPSLSSPSEDYKSSRRAINQSWKESEGGEGEDGDGKRAGIGFLFGYAIGGR